MWTCPECQRRFGKKKQSHECAPAMTFDDYFASGPDFERPVYEAIHAHLETLDRDIYEEPVSVGIFVKRRTTFLQLRTMTKWIAVCFNLNRRLTSDRLARKVIEHSGRFYHVVNVESPGEVDDELKGWLTESWRDDE